MASSRVTVNLRGGLGNQLFQYAAGYAKARHLGQQLALDVSLLPKVATTIGGVSHWPEQISHFKHKAKIVGEKQPLRYAVLSRLLQYERLFGNLSDSRGFTANTYANESGTYHPIFEKMHGPNIRINSYCNDAAFFGTYSSEIRENILAPANKSRAQEDVRALNLEIAPLALHVRLGDYRNLSHIYGKFDPEYYYRAVRLADDLVGKKPVWLYSDQTELALEMLPGLQSRIQTPSDLGHLTGYETLIAMSESSAIVASSSSFSWWAAFLGQKPGFRAIFPRPTFAVGGPAEPKSALLEDWIQIGRQI